MLWAVQIHESLTTIAWDAPRAIGADKVPAVRATLVADQGKMPTDTDPYFFGKEVRLAFPRFGSRACHDAFFPAVCKLSGSAVPKHLSSIRTGSVLRLLRTQQ